MPSALSIYLLGWRRDLLRQPGLWLAAGLAALGLAPVIGWNAAHDWATVRWAIYQGQGFGLPHAGLRASLVHAWRYLTPPASLLAGLAAVIAVLGLRFRQEWRTRARRIRFTTGGLPAVGVVGAGLILPILLARETARATSASVCWRSGRWWEIPSRSRTDRGSRRSADGLWTDGPERST